MSSVSQPEMILLSARKYDVGFRCIAAPRDGCRHDCRVAQPCALAIVWLPYHVSERSANAECCEQMRQSGQTNIMVGWAKTTLVDFNGAPKGGC